MSPNSIKVITGCSLYEVMNLSKKPDIYLITHTLIYYPFSLDCFEDLQFAHSNVSIIVKYLDIREQEIFDVYESLRI